MRIDAEAVKRSLSDPAAVAQALGLKAKRQARGVIVCCPWHDEKTGSCSIIRGADGTISVKCFGCQHTGDVFSLVAAVSGLNVRTDFPAVVEKAAAIAGGVAMFATTGGGIGGFDPKPEPPAIVPISTALFDKIANCLAPVRHIPEVERYVRSRHLDPEELMAVPNGFVEDAIANVGPEAWRRSGLDRPRDGEPGLAWPMHKLVIPWRDSDGRVFTIQRRTLTDFKPKYVFPNGRRPRTPFGCERKPGPAAATVFVEGALDAIALRTIAVWEGLDWYVLAIPGVQNWDVAWAEYARDRVAIVAMDLDVAGERASEMMMSQLRRVTVSLQRERPTHGKDWCDDLAHRVTERTGAR